jgi:hypothetical protein
LNGRSFQATDESLPEFQAMHGEKHFPRLGIREISGVRFAAAVVRVACNDAVLKYFGGCKFNLFAARVII